MHFKKSLAFLLFFLAFFSAFALAENLTPAQKKDAQIMGTVAVIDKNEIIAAQIALRRTSNADVKKFAEAMISQHTQNFADIKKLANDIKIMPMDSSIADMILQNGKKESQELSAVAQLNFDKTYMTAMVLGHEAALKLIDTKLLVTASNPELITFLKNTRATVGHHLQMAKEVGSKL